MVVVVFVIGVQLQVVDVVIDLVGGFLGLVGVVFVVLLFEVIDQQQVVDFWCMCYCIVFDWWECGSVVGIGENWDGFVWFGWCGCVGFYCCVVYC